MVIILLSWAPAAAWAVLLVGTNGTSLTRFDSSTPGTVTTVQVTGMPAGEDLVGIDFRPKNGLLYGVGENGNLYTLNFITGVATKVGAGNGFTLNGTNYATAIDPVTDQLRIVRTAQFGLNKRVNLDTGVLIADDNAIPGPQVAGDPTTKNGPSGIAYSNNYPGASTTTCYAISSSVGRFNTIGDLNGDPLGAESGQLKNGESLVLEGVIDDRLGFDIAPDGTAYAAINYTSQFALYKINLPGGFATKLGNIGTGFSIAFFRGLAVQTGPQTFSSAPAILIPVGRGDGDPTGEEANPYPSQLSVSGMSGKVTSLRITLRDLRHTYPADVNMALEAPPVPNPQIFDGISRMIILSDVGGDQSTCGTSCNNGSSAGTTGVTLTLDDAAPTLLPTEFGAAGKLVSGTFKPTNSGADDPFPLPAPDILGSAQPAGFRHAKALQRQRAKWHLASLRRR